jgi:hypothetical protein
MASKKVWTNDETMPLTALHEASHSLHVLYKARGKMSVYWQAMGEALNASASEVHRKIRNLSYQVFYCMYCVNDL